MHKILFIVTIITLGAGLAAAPCAYCETAAQDKIKYEAKGKRDPFVPLIGQEKAKVAGLENIASVEDINIEGIAIGSGGKNVAILNGQMVKDNDKFGALQIKKVSRKEVKISIDGKDYTLKLPEPQKVNSGV
jgi:hypothetical protein